MQESNKLRFIDAARKKYGDKFDYSHIKYKTQKLPVKISCSLHGVFYQTPDKHLQSIYGCQKCSREATAKKRKLAGQERFLVNFNRNYISGIELLSPYQGIKELIKCRCRKHNITFSTIAESFNLNDYVCPMCANESIGKKNSLNAEEFYLRIKKQFGDTLDFSKTVYSGPHKEVLARCPEHGEFSVLPKLLLHRSYGCPICSSRRKGYASWRLQNIEAMPSWSATSHIGLMKIKVFGITSYKLGTSKRKLQSRYKESLQEIFFDAVLDEIDALRLELMLHCKYSHMRDERIFKAGMRTGKRWSGDSELYSKKALPLLLEDLKRYVNELEDKNPNYWDDKPFVMPPILRIQKLKIEKGIWNMPRPVICLNDMKIYPSATDAGKKLGIRQSNISMVCHGQRGNAGGYKFAYLDDYEQGRLPQFIDRQKGENHPKARAIICIDTGEIYTTSIEAGKSKNISPSHITSVCQGKRKKAGKFRWAYKDGRN